MYNEKELSVGRSRNCIEKTERELRLCVCDAEHLGVLITRSSPRGEIISLSLSLFEFLTHIELDSRATSQQKSRNEKHRPLAITYGCV